MHRLALILLTSCTAMGVAQLRDAAAVALDAEHVCTVADVRVRDTLSGFNRCTSDAR